MLDTHFASNAMGPVIGTIAWLVRPLLQFTPLGHLLRTGPQSGARLAKLATGALLPDITAAFVNDEEAIPSSTFSRSMEGLKYQQEL